ncbi:carbohydrate esterase family 9 protein [Chiua virens]|nr:carbohydrate esterase family 9 protein [Chiua virens]
MDKLPSYYPSNRSHLGSVERPPARRKKLSRIFIFCGAAAAVWLWSASHHTFGPEHSIKVPLHAAETLQKCNMLHVLPGPPPNFAQRTQSDRFVPGTHPTLLKNTSVWTGDSEVYGADVLLDKGMVKFIGHTSEENLADYEDLISVDVGGSWVTPGIVDMHSHIGVSSVPRLNGARDSNSHKGPILPWLRSLDAINTHDDAYILAISGGVTTANVLPGSANAIGSVASSGPNKNHTDQDKGGQAFVIKLRPTEERTPSSMLLEPPYSINDTRVDPSLPPRWKQMKCESFHSRVYSNTRMDNIWAWREAYDTARKIKERQDAYCEKALVGEWNGLGEFPEDLQWEALVDVLRGRVKVHTHCYEAVDLDGFVRLTNEFKFPLAAFHHAHETYLVPGTLKQAYSMFSSILRVMLNTSHADNTPAVALFATNARYKREAYRGSEFAPRILAENGIDIVMKVLIIDDVVPLFRTEIYFQSDHPVLNSRYLLFEAQQAHYYGLDADTALASVTSTPAKVLGLDHRVGYIREGTQDWPDIVMWDSHPLALGATPKQVWIDGIAQIDNPHTSEKPIAFQSPPTTPNFDKEAEAAIKYEGLPPLMPTPAKADTIVFTNVSSVYERSGSNIQEMFNARDSEPGVVVVQNGEIVCYGSRHGCLAPITTSEQIFESFDLQGGSISPGLVSYGSQMGLEEIRGEQSTQDGNVIDPLTGSVPKLLQGNEIMKAVDGLQFAGRDTLLAYRAGVTSAIAPPKSGKFVAGISTAFSTGAAHALQDGAITQDTVALHITIGHLASRSVSTQFAALRHLLLDATSGAPFDRVAKGEIPVVVKTHGADMIASLVKLKKEVEASRNVQLKLTLAGAAEAHLLAKELAEANIGVIVTPSRPFPQTYVMRRILPGPPLTQDTAVTTLLAHGVKVAVGTRDQWGARNTRLDAAWVALESDGRISKAEAIALVSTNVEELLGVAPVNSLSGDYVATVGGSILDFEAQVVGIISSRRHSVEWL